MRGKLVLSFAEIIKSQAVEGWGNWSGCFTRPQVANGRMFVRVMDHLRVYDLRIAKGSPK